MKICFVLNYETSSTLVDLCDIREIYITSVLVGLKCSGRKDDIYVYASENRQNIKPAYDYLIKELSSIKYAKDASLFMIDMRNVDKKDKEDEKVGLIDNCLGYDCVDPNCTGRHLQSEARDDQG